MALRPATPCAGDQPADSAVFVRLCLRSSTSAFTGAGPSRVSHACRTLCRKLLPMNSTPQRLQPLRLGTWWLWEESNLRASFRSFTELSFDAPVP